MPKNLRLEIVETEGGAQITGTYATCRKIRLATGLSEREAGKLVKHFRPSLRRKYETAQVGVWWCPEVIWRYLSTSYRLNRHDQIWFDRARFHGIRSCEPVHEGRLMGSVIPTALVERKREATEKDAREASDYQENNDSNRRKHKEKTKRTEVATLPEDALGGGGGGITNVRERSDETEDGEDNLMKVVNKNSGGEESVNTEVYSNRNHETGMNPIKDEPTGQQIHSYCASLGFEESMFGSDNKYRVIDIDLLMHLRTYSMLAVRDYALLRGLVNRAKAYQIRQGISDHCFAHFGPCTVMVAFLISPEEQEAINLMGGMEFRNARLNAGGLLFRNSEFMSSWDVLFDSLGCLGDGVLDTLFYTVTTPVRVPYRLLSYWFSGSDIHFGRD